MRRRVGILVLATLGVACTGPPRSVAPEAPRPVKIAAPAPARALPRPRAPQVSASSYDTVRLRLRKSGKATVAEVIEMRSVPAREASNEAAERERARVLESLKSVLGDDVDLRDRRDGS